MHRRDFHRGIIGGALASGGMLGGAKAAAAQSANWEVVLRNAKGPYEIEFALINKSNGQLIDRTPGFDITEENIRSLNENVNITPWETPIYNGRPVSAWYNGRWTTFEAFYPRASDRVPVMFGSSQTFLIIGMATASSG